jgi:hypothetical protein
MLKHQFIATTLNIGILQVVTLFRKLDVSYMITFSSMYMVTFSSTTYSMCLKPDLHSLVHDAYVLIRYCHSHK